MTKLLIKFLLVLLGIAGWAFGIYMVYDHWKSPPKPKPSQQQVIVNPSDKEKDDAISVFDEYSQYDIPHDFLDNSELKKIQIPNQVTITDLNGNILDVVTNPFASVIKLDNGDLAVESKNTIAINIQYRDPLYLGFFTPEFDKGIVYEVYKMDFEVLDIPVNSCLDFVLSTERVGLGVSTDYPIKTLNLNLKIGQSLNYDWHDTQFETSSYFMFQYHW